MTSTGRCHRQTANIFGISVASRCDQLDEFCMEPARLYLHPGFGILSTRRSSLGKRKPHAHFTTSAYFILLP
uniref:Uncharacterized protein n=1 Tax=Aegilops tauschii subsp. strangulata TaxID=200361 RepID=A0A453AQH2_AEGTS